MYALKTFFSCVKHIEDGAFRRRASLADGVTAIGRLLFCWRGFYINPRTFPVSFICRGAYEEVVSAFLVAVNNNGVFCGLRFE